MRSSMLVFCVLASQAFAVPVNAQTTPAQTTPAQTSPAQTTSRTITDAARVADVPAIYFPSKSASDVYHGVTIEDTYRELEDTKNPTVQAWMKKQADFTRTVLDRIAKRRDILANIKKYDDAVSARLNQVTRVPGNLYFYEKRGAKDNQYKLYLRQGLRGAETLLVDPEVLSKAGGKPVAINYYSVSPTGRYVAYGISESGSEDASLYLLDTKTKKQIGEPITRANFGGVTWEPDSKYFYLNRLQELKTGMPDTERYQKSQMLRLGVGEPIAKAQVVLTAGKAAGTTTLGNNTSIESAEIPFVEITHDGRWAIGSIVNGVQRELKVFVARVPANLQKFDASKLDWQSLIQPSDAITAASYAQNSLYFMTYKDAPRFRVAKLNLQSLGSPQINDRPSIATATNVVAQSEKVITGIVSAADGLYIEARDGNVKRLSRVSYDSNVNNRLSDKRQLKSKFAVSEAQEIKLPFAGAFSLMSEEGSVGAANPKLPGVIFSLQSWTQASQIYEIDARGIATNTQLQPRGQYDADRKSVV